MIGKGSKRVTIVLVAALLLTAILMVLNVALGSVHIPYQKWSLFFLPGKPAMLFLKIL